MKSSVNAFQENYPFLSCIKYNDYEFVGIIINLDEQITSLYDISMIKSDDEKVIFLEMGEVWWWESNRKIPINIFLKKEMHQFRYMIKSFNSKDVELLFGHAVNLSEIAEKRVKRKLIQLVRLPKNIRN